MGVYEKIKQLEGKRRKRDENTFTEREKSNKFLCGE